MLADVTFMVSASVALTGVAESFVCARDLCG